MGSFLCSCPDGYELSPSGNICQDIDECTSSLGICENGVCTNTVGGALCTCPEGYVLRRTDMKCIDMRKEYCYDSMISGQCKQPRSGSITMKECCCTRGVAWGRRCQSCPREGSRK